MKSRLIRSLDALSLATKREIWKSESMTWKTILMRSFWYQKFEDPTIHATVATCAKFWGLEFQNGFTYVKLRGRDPIFRYCPIIRTCSFTWASQNKFSTTLQISGFISTESQTYFSTNVRPKTSTPTPKTSTPTPKTSTPTPSTGKIARNIPLDENEQPRIPVPIKTPSKPANQIASKLQAGFSI